MLAAAQGQKPDNMSDADVQNVRELYMEILETSDLSRYGLDDFM